MRPVASRLWAAFALVAMLLLALVPAVGRLVEAGPAPAMAQAAAAAHADHASHARHAGHAVHPDGAAAAGHPMPHGADDCAYCPLLAGLQFALAIPCLAAVAPQRAPAPQWTVPQRATGAPVPALGGQGPPRSAMT